MKENLKNFLNKIKLEEDVFDDFIAASKGGKNKVFQNVVAHTFILEDSWVDTVEAQLYSVEQIIRNPKKFISEYDNVVEVERAKRFSAKTVRHLAENTKNISGFSAEGDVIPKKVLTIELKEELGIYENRFICTLVNRLSTFVEKRNNDVKGKMELYNQTNVGYSSEFAYGSNTISYNVQLSVKQPPSDKVMLERNYSLMKRIEAIRLRIRRLKASSFMTELNKLKPIRPPIIKTNMLKLNIDYSNCYRMWLYISTYTSIGFSTEVSEKQIPIDNDYYDDLSVMAALSLKVLLENNLHAQEGAINQPFSQPKAKKYTTLKRFNIKPKFSEKDTTKNADINEYYYVKIKESLTKVPRVTNNTLYFDKKVKMSFTSMFKALNNVTSEIFDEVITDVEDKRSPLKKATIVKKQEALQIAQTLEHRYNLLTKLKEDDLAKTKKKEAQFIAKRKKLEEDVLLLSKKEVAKSKEMKAKELAGEKAKLVEQLKEEKRIKAMEIKLKEQEQLKATKAKEKEEIKLAKAKLLAEQKAQKKMDSQKMSAERKNNKKDVAKLEEVEAPLLNEKTEAKRLVKQAEDDKEIAKMELLKEQLLAEQLEEQRIAEEKRIAKEQAEVARLEEQLLAEQLEEKRIAKEQQVAEEKRIAKEQQVAEEKRIAKEQAEVARLEEKLLAEQLEEQRIAKEQRVAEEKRIAKEQAEVKRLEEVEELKSKKLVEDEIAKVNELADSELEHKIRQLIQKASEEQLEQLNAITKKKLVAKKLTKEQASKLLEAINLQIIRKCKRSRSKAQDKWRKASKES